MNMKSSFNKFLLLLNNALCVLKVFGCTTLLFHHNCWKIEPKIGNLLYQTCEVISYSELVKLFLRWWLKSSFLMHLFWSIWRFACQPYNLTEFSSTDQIQLHLFLPIKLTDILNLYSTDQYQWRRYDRRMHSHCHVDMNDFFF